MTRYVKAGARGIMTNFPGRLLKVAREHNKRLVPPGHGIRSATTNTVVAKLEVGALCSKYSSCQNGACARKTAADNEPTICCPSGKMGTYAFYDYCYGMPDGSVCWSDAMCANGDCAGVNAPVKRKGTCGGREVGWSCGVDAECKNRACGRKTADDENKICCPSGGAVRWAKYAKDYCTGMPAGTSCGLDKMCASGSCKGNALGFKKGKCK